MKYSFSKDSSFILVTVDIPGFSFFFKCYSQQYYHHHQHSSKFHLDLQGSNVYFWTFLHHLKDWLEIGEHLKWWLKRSMFSRTFQLILVLKTDLVKLIWLILDFELMRIYYQWTFWIDLLFWSLTDRKRKFYPIETQWKGRIPKKNDQ